MKKLLIFVSAAMLVGLARANAQSFMKPREMGGGGFTIGYGNLNVSGLHAFVPSDVKAFSNDQLVVGGMGYGFVDNLVIGGSGFGVVGDDIRTDSLQVSLGGGLGTFDVGYLLLNSHQVKLFPMVGFGGGGYGISIAENRNVSVNDILQDPGREIHINKGGLLIDASVNLALVPFLTYDAEDNTYGGFMTGFKAGYVFSLSNSDWSFTGGDVTGGPDFKMRMFYVKMIIGGFGYQDKNQIIN